MILEINLARKDYWCDVIHSRDLTLDKLDDGGHLSNLDQTYGSAERNYSKGGTLKEWKREHIFRGL